MRSHPTRPPGCKSRQPAVHSRQRILRPRRRDRRRQLDPVHGEHLVTGAAESLSRPILHERLSGHQHDHGKDERQQRASKLGHLVRQIRTFQQKPDLPIRRRQQSSTRHRRKRTPVMAGRLASTAALSSKRSENYFARYLSKNAVSSPKCSLVSGASGSPAYCACDCPSNT